MLVTPALRRQKQDFWDLMPTNLAYLMGSRHAREFIAKKRGGWMVPEEPHWKLSFGHSMFAYAPEKTGYSQIVLLLTCT